MSSPAMFCYQCQETARGKGCEMVGVCGKRPATSARMDLLLYAGETGACWDSMGGIKQCRNLHFRAGRQD